jgi:hypothetical protein
MAEPDARRVVLLGVRALRAQAELDAEHPDLHQLRRVRRALLAWTEALEQRGMAHDVDMAAWSRAYLAERIEPAIARLERANG